MEQLKTWLIIILSRMDNIIPLSTIKTSDPLDRLIKKLGVQLKKLEKNQSDIELVTER